MDGMRMSEPPFAPELARYEGYVREFVDGDTDVEVGVLLAKGGEWEQEI